jgi:serine/threonine protein kinase
MTSSSSSTSSMGFANLQFVQELGKGAFGSVVLAIDADSNQLVAVKKLPRASVQSRYTESELINHRLVTCHWFASVQHDTSRQQGACWAVHLQCIATRPVALSPAGPNPCRHTRAA